MNFALACAAAAGVQVGAAIVVSRFVVHDTGPFTLALARYAIGALCLLPLIAARGPRAGWVHMSWRDAVSVAALGMGQFGLLIALLNWGLTHVGAAQAALVFSAFPLLTMVLAAAMGREALSRGLLVGVLLSMAGVALVLWPGMRAGGMSAPGLLAVLASAGVGALCSVLYRPYLSRYPTAQVSVLAMLAAVVFLALLALVEHWPARLAALSSRGWLAVGFVGLSSGLGYLAWLHALKHESPTRVTVFLALNPVTAVVLGVAWLGEPVAPGLLVALPLVALGLWAATRGRPA